MQQRPTTSSSSRAQEPDNSMIMKATPPLQQQAKYSPKNSISMDDSCTLPVYFRSSSNPFKKSVAQKLVHAIPFVVLICLVILWWFSYPVNLVMKDSKIEAIHRVEMPLPFNNQYVELAILVSATSPVAAVAPHNITMEKINETEASPLSEIFF